MGEDYEIRAIDTVTFKEVTNFADAVTIRFAMDAMDLDGLSKEEVVQLEIPTGVPICYNYSNKGFVKEPALT